MTNDYYFEKMKSIRTLLIRSFIDFFILDIIEKQKSNNGLNSNSIIVLLHFCELLKCDLMLNIWKIWLDNDTKAVTLPSINRFLRNHNIKSSYKRPDLLSQNEYALKIARNRYISHNDCSNEEFSIKVNELKAILDESKNVYNKLCYEGIDSRVNELNDNEIAILNIKEIISFLDINNLEVN